MSRRSSRQPSHRHLRGKTLRVGARTRRSPVQSRPRNQAVRQRMVEIRSVPSFFARDLHEPQVHYGKLMNLLNEFLAAEEGSLQLIELTLERSQDPDVRDQLRRFLNQVQTHIDGLETAIRDLGGNPSEITTGAHAQRERSHILLGMDFPPELQEVSDIDNLVITGTKCQQNWEFLRALLPHLDDPHTRGVIEEIVARVEPEKDEQVQWAAQTVARLMFRDLIQRRDESLAA
jgi:hypothetical protein